MLDIKSYEAMAKLSLTDTERNLITGYMKMLGEGFNRLKMIDTDGVEPLITVLDVQNVLRDDICKQELTRKEVMANAPEQYEGFFQTPRTIE